MTLVMAHHIPVKWGACWLHLVVLCFPLQFLVSFLCSGGEEERGLFVEEFLGLLGYVWMNKLCEHDIEFGVRRSYACASYIAR